jgi:hypothetical protein
MYGNSIYVKHEAGVYKHDAADMHSRAEQLLVASYRKRGCHTMHACMVDWWACDRACRIMSASCVGDGVLDSSA